VAALREFLMLRKPRSGFLEARTAPVRPCVSRFTGSKAGAQGHDTDLRRWVPAFVGTTMHK
jgi:hypothetical protein